MPTRHAAVASTPRRHAHLRMAPAALMLGAFSAQAADPTPVADPAPASIFLPAAEQRTGRKAGQPGIFLPRPGGKAASGADETPVRSITRRTPAAMAAWQQRGPGLAALPGAPVQPPAGPVPPGLQTTALPATALPTQNDPRAVEPTGNQPRQTAAVPVADNPRPPIDSQARLTARILTAVTAALGMGRRPAHQAGAPHKTGADSAVADAPAPAAAMPVIPAMAPRRADRARPVQARAAVLTTTDGIVLPPGGTGSDLSSRINRAVRAALIDDGADAAQQGPEAPAVDAVPATAPPEPVIARDEAADAAVPALVRDDRAAIAQTDASPAGAPEPVQPAADQPVAPGPAGDPGGWLAAGDATASRADRLSARIYRAVLDALANRKP